MCKIIQKRRYDCTLLKSPPSTPASSTSSGDHEGERPTDPSPTPPKDASSIEERSSRDKYVASMTLTEGQSLLLDDREGYSTTNFLKTLRNPLDRTYVDNLPHSRALSLFDSYFNKGSPFRGHPTSGDSSFLDEYAGLADVPQPDKETPWVLQETPLLTEQHPILVDLTDQEMKIGLRKLQKLLWQNSLAELEGLPVAEQLQSNSKLQICFFQINSYFPVKFLNFSSDNGYFYSF
ncbi:hypothetical protein Salat_2614200 [Sesamum alatum]|uniref:Uncharacterized protein n=1 Tax=Sesamum alatum TaxID=300844 RepID=A0AAE2CAL7_9LAMI|nr:hypothetical protein Salat_2614200 [Sesamum alatum]